MNTRISVVVPLYNKRREIRRCLDSIAAQTVQPDEVIIVDDGSTDGSPEIASAALRPGMRIISQANQGECAARNTGIRAAREPLIAFLDADDEWHPGFLQEIRRLESVFPQAAAFGTASITDKGSLGRFNVICNVPDELTLVHIGQAFRNGFGTPAGMWSSSVAIRRYVFDTVGFFRQGIRRGGDLDMWLRIACVYPIAYSKVPRAVWHWTAANRSTALAPNEEDFMGASLQELINSGLLTDTVLSQARAWVRRCQFANALALAKWDHVKGIRALRSWQRENGATLGWYLHYVPLALHPRTYWSLIQCGSRVKAFLRSMSTT